MATNSDAQAAEDADADMTFGQKVKQELKEWAATLAVFIPAFLIFSGLLFEQRVIPSESMVPTLQVSDRVAVSKYAYGYGRYSLPFSLGRYLPLPEGRIFARTPERGDVVVFEHTHTPRVMIKRVIGLPGDQIQMINEVLYRNGEPVEAEDIRTVRYVPHKDTREVTAEEWRSPVFKQPAEELDLAGFGTLDAGNLTGYAEIETVQHDAKTGEAFGVATNSGAYQYPWGVERFEERIEHRTSDANPAKTSVKGIYALQEELPGRLLRFEQDVTFRSDLENFYLTFKRRVLVNGKLEHEKEWKETIPRDFQ